MALSEKADHLLTPGVTLPLHAEHETYSTYTAARRRWSARLFPLICALLLILVVLQFISLLPLGLSYLFLRAGHWPTEFHHHNHPSSCIAYNPLHSHSQSNAIQSSLDAGCTGAKADVWLRDDDLFVARSEAALDERNTLRKVYLEPLFERLEGTETGWLFDDDDDDDDYQKTFTLLLELRTPTPQAWRRLVDELQVLSQMRYLTLSHGNATQSVVGPVTVVLVSGSSDSDTDPDHDFDLGQDEPLPFVLEHSYMQSINFTAEIGTPRRGYYSRQQMQRMRGAVQAAHRRGVRARVTAIPSGGGRRAWRMVVREGADLVEVDWREKDVMSWRMYPWKK